MTQPDISVVVASYNTAEITVACVRSVLQHGGEVDVEVLVVDDASPDDSVAQLRTEFDQITLLVNEQNQHYAKTNNRGLRECNGRYAMLLNSDTIMQPRTLETLVEYMDAHPEVDACGPKLTNPDGTVQYCIRSFPSVGVMFFQALNLHKLWRSNPITNRYYHLDLDYETTHTVDSLGTTAFVIRRSVWESGMYLDERFKIAFVDLAYCARLGQLGHRIDYVGGVSVVHLGSQSINLNSSGEVRSRADGLRLLYDEYLASRDPAWKRPIVRVGIVAWGVLRRIEHRISRDKRVITGPGAPNRTET
jgi:GT2 family glycosyltransferase